MAESPGMRVLVFEPQFAGHNLTYVMHLVTRLVAMKCDVHLVTSKQAVESEEFSNHLGHLVGSYECHALDGFVQRPRAQGISVNGPAGNYSIMKGLLHGLRRVQPGHVFIPFGNPIAHWAGIPNPVSMELRKQSIESELVLLFGKYAYEHRGWKSHLKERIALAVLSRGPWTRIHHIVPHAVQVMKSYSDKLASKTHLLPDPVDRAPEMLRTQAREILGIPLDGRNISLVGLIERRKGVFQLLEAFAKAIPDLKHNDRVLLAGKTTEEVKTALNGRFAGLLQAGRILSIDRHLSANELWAACVCANVVCTPYPNHRYSASIVIRAAASGVPLLANSIGWMHEMIHQFSLGVTCNTNDEASFAKNIRLSLDRSHEFRIGESAKRFVEFHSAQNFASHLTKRLSERVGDEAQGMPTLSWESVNEYSKPMASARVA
jgi:glycosyltransferase involved in cell wall biosynthesis